MNKIIPAVNAQDFPTAETFLVLAQRFLHHGDFIHIDVVDGHFAPNITWDNAHDLELSQRSSASYADLNFEIHLMVLGPEEKIEPWLRAGAKRIIAHVESLHDHHFLLDQCEKYGADLMLAVAPESPVEKFFSYLQSVKYFQILAVKPGLAGQKFKPEVINKIETLRKKAPNVKIEVDGGINPETAEMCKKAGADFFVSASYIFNHKNPGEAFQELLKAVK